jgi:ubiquinone/menaquinone biosynthesis C-methylase UbiE
VASPDHKKTYREDALIYDQLISREDYQGNILCELERICPPEGLEILDLGAGTGRLEWLLADRAKMLTALDLSHAMLQVARQRQAETNSQACQFAAADHRALPLGENRFDLVLSGWSICYLVDWYPDSWREELSKAFNEIGRVIRPGGSLILLETQGTGFKNPHPPQHLEGYFKFLRESGFSYSWVRTDYEFASLEEAEKICQFFFGDELADKVRANGWVIVPECTGFWVKNL